MDIIVPKKNASYVLKKHPEKIQKNRDFLDGRSFSLKFLAISCHF